MVSLLVACQSTPDERVIIQKDLEQMITLATSGQKETEGLINNLGIPARYETSREKGSFKVTVDANVVLPDTDKIPLIRVEAQFFNQEMVDGVINQVFNKDKLYDPYLLSNRTKLEIAEILIDLNNQKRIIEQQGTIPLNTDLKNDNEKDSSGVYSADQDLKICNQLDVINDTIKVFEDLQKNASDEKQFNEVKGLLQNCDITAGLPMEERKAYQGKRLEMANASQMNPQGGMRSIFAVNDEVYNRYSLTYINRRDFDTMFGEYYTEEIWMRIANEHDVSIAKALSDPTLTMKQAQDIADDFLLQIGIDNLVCERSEKVIGGFGFRPGEVRMGNLVKGYCLQYVRDVRGAPVTYTNIESVSSGNEEVFWNWAYEKMTVIVDDSGIVGMLWEAPYKLLDTITDNTTMLPFSQIQDVFEKMIIISNSYYEERRAHLHITEVRLGMMRICEQDCSTTGLLIPVWDFFGTLTTYYEEEGVQKSHTQDDMGQSWLTINAIDGSIINRCLGY